MVIAGLTGGIATGKSTVAGFLKEAGAEIVDADGIARDVVQKGLPAWRKIVDSFGRAVLLESGDIDREKLGRIIFYDARKKDVLDRIVHPEVFSAMCARLKQIRQNSPDAVVIQDIPLLFESAAHHRLPRVIVVYIPEHLQLERLMRRNHLTGAEASARIRSQMPIEEKKKLADILIDNSGPLEQTRKRSMEVYDMLKSFKPDDDMLIASPLSP